MAFKTYGASDAPDLVSESSVLAGKLDASEQSDGTIRLAQAFAGSFDVGSYAQGPSSTPTPRQIHNVATPTADTDAATKGYVDGATSSGIIITDVCEAIAIQQILVNGSVVVEPTSHVFKYANNLKALIINNKPIIIYSLPGGNAQTSLTISHEFAKGDMVHVEASLYNVNQDFIDCVTLGDIYPLRAIGGTENIISSASMLVITPSDPHTHTAIITLDTEIIVGVPTNNIAIDYC